MNEIKELSFELMRNEVNKVACENDLFDGYIGQFKSPREKFETLIDEYDTEGYKVALKMQKKVHETGELNSDWNNEGPNAPYHCARNLLLKYGFNYPRFYRYTGAIIEGKEIIDYDDEVQMKSKHETFVKDMETEFNNKKIDQFTRTRLQKATDFMFQYMQKETDFLADRKNDNKNKEKIVVEPEADQNPNPTPVFENL